MDPAEPTLTKPIILSAFERLSQGLEAQGIIGEPCLFGGTAMMLAFDGGVLMRMRGR